MNNNFNQSNMKQEYQTPSIRSLRLRPTSLLAGSSTFAPEHKTLHWTVSESIDPNGEALARKRGSSLD
jgi:hypothetical protein